ncbi:hypothetical protein GCM10010442_69580 [Kitasatospora kifunensis]
MQLPVTASSLEQAEEAGAWGYHGLEHEVSIRCGGRRGNGISVAGGLVVTLGGRPGAGITVGYRLRALDAPASREPAPTHRSGQGGRPIRGDRPGPSRRLGAPRPTGQLAYAR